MKKIPKHTLAFIGSWLELTTKWEETTGLALTITHKGKIVFDETYGTSKLVDGKKKLAYRVASQSKTFTAVAIMQLQEKGKLRIDDTVAQYLPWLKSHKDERWKTITIRQLLSHSAGIIRDGESLGFWSLQSPFPSAEELKKEILKRDLVLEPNTQLKYSNFGYGLLGLVLEAVTKQSYEEYIKSNIIDVLELKNTRVDVSDDLSMATGYSKRSLSRKRFAFPQIKTNALAAATGFCSTPVDMCTFFNALKVGSGKLLDDTSKREMQRKQWDINKEDDSYGLGTDIAERHGFQLIGHSGGFPGFSSRTWMDIGDDITVSLAVTEHGTWTGPIAASIFAIFKEFGDEDPKKELLKYEGRFVGLHEPIEIVAHAGGLRRIYPAGWWPMEEVDKLKIIDRATLQLHDVSGFDEEGEKVFYTFDDKNVPSSIKISGTRYVPSEDADLVPWW